MGFQCLLNQKHIYSFSLTDEEWHLLRANYKKEGLKISCCSTDCYPKENQLGTRFFAHKKLADCPFSEIKASREHQYLKYIISRTLVELGWSVEHDYRGRTPDGKAWTADIFAEKNESRFIFEILWDEGSVSLVMNKCSKYAASGIRSAWFMRVAPSKGFPYSTYKALTDIKIASFPFKYERKEKQFFITNLSKVSPENDIRKYESLELCSFIDELFKGQIHILGNLKAKYTMSLRMTSQTCWNCYRETNLAHKADFSILHHGEQLTLLQVEVAALPMEILALINQQLFLEANLLGELIARPDNKNPSPPISNGCFYCGAIQANFYKITQFGNNNSFDSSQIEITMPLGFPMENKVFWLDQ